ncbi:hypothetical protein VP01_690g5 [Puccinia sorghi]|uniref:Uncharacterized protein n=1 Tax=Puccinia sorghi TaxID=27349 RepID=A0A0L6UGE3_9BASI|nr:hypothetical protein VP01_690g5 [Puccinia sorghi]
MRIHGIPFWYQLLVERADEEAPLIYIRAPRTLTRPLRWEPWNNGRIPVPGVFLLSSLLALPSFACVNINILMLKTHLPCLSFMRDQDFLCSLLYGEE